MYHVVATMGNNGDEILLVLGMIDASHTRSLALKIALQAVPIPELALADSITWII